MIFLAKFKVQDGERAYVMWDVYDTTTRRIALGQIRGDLKSMECFETETRLETLTEISEKDYEILKRLGVV